MRPLSMSSIPEIAILAVMVVYWVVMIVATYLTSADVLFAKRPPETRRERVVTTCALATLGSFLAATVLAPPEPFSQILWHLGGLLVTGPAAVLYVAYGAALRDAL